MTLIRDLIHIPERVSKGDFVLRLTEGVARPEETLASYVVTGALTKNFDAALAVIRSAVESSSSKAAYLHGSFGSGKSHFMAVLDLLLAGNVKARGLPELAPVLSTYGDWLKDKRFLLVPYHMIGARSMEAAILGGYVDHVRALHPDAPVPAVFLGESLFDDARRQRETYGDEKFFALLNEGKSEGGGKWGSLATRWDPASFEAAMAAGVRDDRRGRLVSDLVGKVFRSYRNVAEAGEEGFVSLDDGLSIVSRHARDLGYDAVILFLDELILWLASRVADMDFVTREGQKLAKLVESTTADRPVPLVSFVARQRDLRELVGEHVPGAEKLGFSDVLKWWEGRFDLITLEDRNLPTIAEKRVLRPVSEQARVELDRAFEQATRTREEVMRVLLTRDADRGMFRQVYPFSPALVQTLVAVSSALQRERTALKVMMQLLVAKRDTLALGDLVPVGDLFDAIAEGDEPFTEEMRNHFQSAKKLYYEKLLPLLEQEYNLRKEEIADLPHDDPNARAFRSDDGLLKTALLAALVPEVESLKDLTGSKLAALNHGTIRSPLEGREATVVLTKFKKWAGHVGEIKIGEGQNPTIQLQVVGIDTEAILAKAEAADTGGERQRAVRAILFQEMGLRFEDTFYHEHEFRWRGSRRHVEVVYSNIRALPDESLQPSGAGWKVVIDYPFDAEGHGAADDRARIEAFKKRHGNTRTLCWTPVFLSRELQRDLGVLCKLEYVLKNDDRLCDHTAHLSATERSQARSLLENRRSQLRGRVRSALEAAYGVTQQNPDLVEPSHELIDCFQSLDATFRPAVPVGANLGEALQHLLDQVMAHEYPGHPKFAADVTLARLRRVRAELERATQDPDGRIVVEEKSLRPEMRDMAEGLGLGKMHEDAFVLDNRWKHHFIRKSGEAAGAVTAGKLRAWMDDPKPMGLEVPVANLIILVYADQNQQSFFLHGGPYQPRLEDLPDAVELREQPLPDRTTWDKAVARAARVFGLVKSSVLTANSVAELVVAVKEKAEAGRTGADRLPAALEGAFASVGGVAADAARLKTARSAQALVQAMGRDAEYNAAVARLASLQLETSDEAVAKSLSAAARVVQAIEASQLVLFESLRSIDEERQAPAGKILATLREALGSDELVVELAPVLQSAMRDAAQVLAQKPVARKPAVEPGWSVVDSGEATVNEANDLDQWRHTAADRLAANRRMVIRWSVEERFVEERKGKA